MDTLTEARAVVAPKRRVSSETAMTDSLTLAPPLVALGGNVNNLTAYRTARSSTPSRTWPNLARIQAAPHRAPSRSGLLPGSRRAVSCAVSLSRQFVDPRVCCYDTDA